MSSMDTGNQLRSQEFVQRSEMQSQSLRQDSANQMVGGLQQTLEAARQFAMLKAEADARLQMHEQEMQINAVKLQHMQALDATDLMGHQVEAARLQNEAAAFALQQEKDRSESWKKSGMDSVEMEVAKALGGGRGMAYAGIRLQKGKGFVALTPEEQAALLRTDRTANQRGIDLRTLLRSYEESGDEENAARVRAEIESGVPDLPAAPKKPPPPVPLDPKVEAELVPAMQKLTHIIGNEAERKLVVTKLWEHRVLLTEGANAARDKENRPTPFSEKEAIDLFLEAAANRSHPKHEQAAALIRAISGVSLLPVPSGAMLGGPYNIR